MCQTVSGIVEPFATMDEFLGKLLKEHEETYDPSKVRDFVDICIKTRSENEDAHLYDGEKQRIEYFRNVAGLAEVCNKHVVVLSNEIKCND